jgi:predicted nucleic acid binding AN1-type Zn finger protein
MRTTTIVRWLFAGLLLAAFAGCRSMGSGSPKPKKCEDCTNGTCSQHTVGSESHDPGTTPSQAPFAPYSVGK